LYNTSAASTDPADPNSKPVNPENIDAYEIGIKADLLGQTLRFNTAVFYYEYQDIQILNNATGSNFLVNAAESQILGLDADITWIATENLTLTGGVSILDTEYSDWPDATTYVPTGVGGNMVVVQDVKGDDMINAPKLTYNLGITYAIETDSGQYGAYVNYYYNDGFNWEVTGRLNQDSYSVVNAELSWLSTSGYWKVRLFGKNLTDEDYSPVVDTGGIGDAIAAAPPLTYGVGLQYIF
jgi:iron complex outermembrane receptor protein